MSEYYVFDVDGTIVPARQPMEKDFVPKFLSFCKSRNVVLVSGSTKLMILEQIPEEILQNVTLYTCSGIEGCSIPVDYEIEDDDLLWCLQKFVDTTAFRTKTGKHIDIRKGMINFSIVGRNASIPQRTEYLRYDAAAKERQSIINVLSREFPEYEFVIGGEISIDITKKGVNKSLVAKDLLTLTPNASIIFYGDKILEGNDLPLAKYIQENDLGYSINISYSQLKKSKLWQS